MNPESASVFPLRVFGLPLLHVLEEEDHSVDVPDLAPMSDHESSKDRQQLQDKQSVRQQNDANRGVGVSLAIPRRGIPRRSRNASATDESPKA